MIPASSFDVMCFLAEIGINIEELSIQETVDASTVEFDYFGEIQQYAW